MPVFSPDKLAEWTSGRWEGPAPVPVHGFSFDSRLLRPGECFVCLRTGRRDGHAFLRSAAEAGAAGALVERADRSVDLPQLVAKDPLSSLQTIAENHRAGFGGPVIGVTGSCGKTSTKDLLSLLLGGPETVHATAGNFNNLIGVPVTLTGIDPQRHEAAVVEAGINQPGEMRVLARMIRPSHALVTLIAPAHLEQLGSLEKVAAEKALLASRVPSQGAVALPLSCMGFDAFRNLGAKLLVAVPEGFDGTLPDQAEPVPYRIRQEKDRTEIHLTGSFAGGDAVHSLGRTSDGMAANAVLAIALARFLGLDREKIDAGLRRWKPASRRGEFVKVGSTRFFVDCYNANPAAMRDAIQYFQSMASGLPRLYFIGCMSELGASSAAFHRDLGRWIRLRPLDRVCLIGDVSDADALESGLLEGGIRPAQIIRAGEVLELMDTALGHEGDVFLKGSRIHRMEALIEAATKGREAAC